MPLKSAPPWRLGNEISRFALDFRAGKSTCLKYTAVFAGNPDAAKVSKTGNGNKEGQVSQKTHRITPWDGHGGFTQSP
jgi:hypothetical protein